MNASSVSATDEDLPLNYAWYLRHRPTHKWLSVDMKEVVPLITTVDSHKDATPFYNRVQARDTLTWLVTGEAHDYEILDYAIRPEPAPDADKTPVRSFGQVLADVTAERKAREAQRAHEGKGAVLTDAPPMGEKQRQEEAEKPVGYGQGGFANAPAPLFPVRRSLSPATSPTT